MKERGKSVKENEKSYLKDKTAHDKLQREVAKLRESLGRLDYQEGQQESLMSRRYITKLFRRLRIIYRALLFIIILT